MKRIFLLLFLCATNIAFTQEHKSFMFNDLQEQNISAENIETYFQKRFLLNQDYSFKRISETTDNLGLQHINYKEYYKGIEVEDVLLMVHANKGIVYCVNGQIMQEDGCKKPEVSLLKSSVPDSSLKIIGIQKDGEIEYRTTVEGIEGLQKIFTDVQTGKVLRTVPMVHQIGDIEGKAYTFYNGLMPITTFENQGVYFLADEKRNILTIDAGAISADNYDDLNAYVDDCMPFYSGFSTWSRPRLKKICIDRSSDWWGSTMTDKRPDFYVKVKDQYGRTLYTSSTKDDMQPPIEWNVDIELDGEKIVIELYEEDVLKDDGPISEVCVNYRTLEGYYKWEETDTHGRLYFSLESPEYDAHWGMEQTYDYYLETFNRKSFDGNGSPIYNILNTDLMGSQLNACAVTIEPYPMVFGLGGYIEGHKMNPVVNLDVMAHEFTHLITDFNGNGGLNYYGESGALNESFSDIFAACVEFYAKGEDANWLIGEYLMPSYSNLRDISNPKNGCDGDIFYSLMGYPQPDTYGGDYWQDITAGDDQGGVHRNSGVQNYWFYLLCEGGTGINDNYDTYNVIGIGMNDAQQIAYRNLMTYLTPNATHRDACDGSIQAARDLFGKGSQQEKSVKDAWAAVGVSYELNYAYLQKMMSVADSLLTNTQVGTEIGQYGQQEYLALDSVQKAAKKFISIEDNTQQDIYAQSLALEIVLNNYISSIVVDKKALLSSIHQADSLLKNSQIGTNPGQFGQREFLVLQEELEYAQDVLNSDSSTKYDIDEATEYLNNAIGIFLSSKVPVNTQDLIYLYLRADNLLRNTQVGTEIGQYGQSEYLILYAEIKKAAALIESDGVEQVEIDAEIKALLDAISSYQRSEVGRTAIDSMENKMIVIVEFSTITCNIDEFQIIDALGKNVTARNGNLLPGVYIVVSPIGTEKVTIQ